MPVTQARKRYMARARSQAPYIGRVFVCVGCGCLSDSTRAHAITCSPACRVRMHRNPATLEHLERLADGLDISVASILECKAIRALRPDLAAEIQAGSKTIEGTRGEVYREYLRLVYEASGEVTA